MSEQSRPTSREERRALRAAREAEALAAWVRKVVEASPPLTGEQRARLAALFTPHVPVVGHELLPARERARAKRAVVCGDDDVHD